jgi:NAD(P)-dependent dehydrogenase (short-subunit alcohol dehydrogenase family)
MKTVAPYMQKNGGGSIINCNSITSLLGAADFGATAYASAKGGMRSLSRLGAAHFAKDNIRVNTIFPGSVYTGAVKRSGATFEQVAESFKERIPLPPHFGMPDDIAYGYLYLASDESKFISGAELWIDGGQIASY